MCLAGHCFVTIVFEWVIIRASRVEGEFVARFCISLSLFSLSSFSPLSLSHSHTAVLMMINNSGQWEMTPEPSIWMSSGVKLVIAPISWSPVRYLKLSISVITSAMSGHKMAVIDRTMPRPPSRHFLAIRVLPERWASWDFLTWPSTFFTRASWRCEDALRKWKAFDPWE